MILTRRILIFLFRNLIIIYTSINKINISCYSSAFPIAILFLELYIITMRHWTSIY